MIGKIFFMHYKINPGITLKKNVGSEQAILTKYYLFKNIEKYFSKAITPREINII